MITRNGVLIPLKRVLARDRFDGVRVIGVDEHVWRHTRRGDKYVTIIIARSLLETGGSRPRLHPRM